MIGNALLVVVSFVVGWIALWPARRALGAWEYHLAALPVGLVGWTAAAGVAAILGRPLTPVLALPAVLAYAGAVLWFLRAQLGSAAEEAAPPPLWTFLVAGGLVVASTAVSTAAGFTVVNYDSWAHYQISAIFLADHGVPSSVTFGQYGPLIPSVIAAGRMLGGDWIYALYPVMGVNLLLLTARSVYRFAVPRIRRWPALGLAVVTGTVLALTRWFIVHMVYVHSQMYSALFLTLAVVPIILAVDAEERAGDSDSQGSISDSRLMPVLAVSGLATAGLALTRPDGLVYVFVPLLLVLALRFERGWPTRRVTDYAVPLVAVLAVSYVPAFLRLGLWGSGKLSGRVALLSIVLVVGALAAGEALARWERVAWLRRSHRAIRGVLLLDVLAVAAAAALMPQRFFASVRNMVINLFSTGAYGHLWYFLAGVIVVTICLGVLKRGDTPVYTLFAIAQFFAVALVVHGLAHAGRLNPTDSFNRVAFHIVPTALWYCASAVVLFWPLRTAGDDRL